MFLTVMLIRLMVAVGTDAARNDETLSPSKVTELPPSIVTGTFTEWRRVTLIVAGPPQLKLMRPPIASACVKLVPPDSMSVPHRSTVADKGSCATAAVEKTTAARQTR